MSGPTKCNFSIEHILTVAGNAKYNSEAAPNYDWLQCTRYRPPRIQRPKKKDYVQKRNPGRNPRIPFSPTQVSLLEDTFQRTPYLSSHQVHNLAANLELSEIRVKIWFQNRRARERREQEAVKKEPTQKLDVNQPISIKQEENKQQDYNSLKTLLKKKEEMDNVVKNALPLSGTLANFNNVPPFHYLAPLLTYSRHPQENFTFIHT